ncbi:OmpP1/FadL family transporter [Inquilinus limosus]|uniref:OmpP1/FadL family transporter n=1 Tax=Inquilinus limosus TaxID=171674 RepID=UPI000408986C|nr:outer membrane protein transport protein [Inquilinus limosus]
MKQGIIGTVSRFALAVAGLSAAAGLGAGSAQAAGFYIQEQSVTGLGRAFAGSAAAADDASTIYFNPAGMGFLKSGEIMIGGSLLIPDSRLKDDGSTIDYPAFRTPLGILNPPAAAISGDSKSGNPYDPTLVPSGYVAVPVPNTENRLWFGIGLGAPFGLESDYGGDWFGRYDATKTELQVFNFAPSVAYRVNDWLSIGGGIDISYAWAKLESKVPNPVAPIAPAFADDGDLTIKGDSWAIGYNIGAIVQPMEGTRIGVHFRSGVDHMLDGRAKLDGIDFPPLPGLPATADFATGGRAKLNLPPILSFGIRQEVTPQIALLGGVTWYGWSSFKEIRVKRSDGGDDLVNEQRYQDTVGLSIGGEYYWNEDLTLRAGFQYDPTPTKAGFRSSRTPDGDRYWLSAGLSYDVMENLSVDFAYTHIFIDARKMDAERDFYIGTPLETHVDYDAKNEGSVDIVALGLRYRF